MKPCPKCKAALRRVEVTVHGAKAKALSFQCTNCDYFEFDADSGRNVVDELKSPLKIRHKVVNISQDRLGIYFNNNIIRSLGLKKGEDVFISVPDKKHMVIEII